MNLRKETQTMLETAHRLIKSSKHKKAEEILMQAKELDPENSTIWHYLGVNRSIHGDNAGALSFFQQAVKLNSNDIPSVRMLANTLITLGKSNEAEPYIRKLLQLLPNDAAAWDALANLQRSRNQFDEAEKSLRKALELDPQLVQGWMNLGVMLIEQKRLEEAIGPITRVTEIFPTFPGGWEALTAIYEDLGREKEAKEARKKWKSLEKT
jgi:superkiller protein 3